MLNLSLVFSLKTHTSFIHNCNLQTTPNEHKFLHFHLENIITKIPTNYPTNNNWNFNINMLTNTIESIILENYMKTHGFHITFIKSTTPNSTQINHIWTNAPIQQCHSGSTQAC